MIIYSLVEFTSYMLNTALERGFHYSEKINTLNKCLSINQQMFIKIIILCLNNNEKWLKAVFNM